MIPKLIEWDSVCSNSIVSFEFLFRYNTSPIIKRSTTKNPPTIPTTIPMIAVKKEKKKN